MKTTSIVLSLLLPLVVLQGCGNKGNSASGASNGSVRLVNATAAFASLDMTTSGPTAAPTTPITLATAVATGSASSYVAIAPGSYPVSLNVSGSGTPVAQQFVSIASGSIYTLVAFTARGQLQLAELTDNEVAPAAGDGKIRLSNLALSDTGGVDVYVAGSGVTLANASPLVTSLGTASNYYEIPQGTYHIWVTGLGNKADVRLDLPAVVISNQQVLTLVLTATSGGVLVDGWLVTQQGTVTTQPNTLARIRVAASVAAFGTVVATANGVLLDASTLVSPALDTYALVPAGSLSMSVVVNGNPINVPNLNAAAGADLTLLAVGTAASPQFSLLSDDNRLPVGGVAKIRLVNGINGITGNISLTVDANLVAQNVALGTASTAGTVVTSGNISQLQANGPGNTSLGASVATLKSQGVYSVFMLGDNTAPAEIVRVDR